MKLYVETSRTQFTVTQMAREKTDQNGRQKVDRNTNELLWIVQVMALDETGGEMLNITLAGSLPTVKVGQQVIPVELEALPWATGGKNGVAFRAKSLNAATGSKAA